MEFLSDRELAKLTDDEIGEYVNSLFNEGARLRYAYSTPTSKFWKRIADYRKGKDADVDHPKRRDTYTYQYGDKKVTIRKSTKSGERSGVRKSSSSVPPKKSTKTSPSQPRPEVKKVVLSVGGKE